MRAQESVFESKLPSHAKFLLISLNIAAWSKESKPSEDELCQQNRCTLRTVRKYLRVVDAAVGEEPYAFLRDVIDRKRSNKAWKAALSPR